MIAAPILNTQELKLSDNLLNVNGGIKNKTLVFKGVDGSRYDVTFEISKG